MPRVDPTFPAEAISAHPLFADPHGTAQALVERQLEVLTRLAEIGMSLAEAAERCALAAAEDRAAEAPGGFGDPGLVYSRVARAVRLTLMLQTRLLKELPDLGKAETLARISRQQGRRERAHRLVEQAIKAEHDDADDVEQLSGDAWERLRDEDLSEEIGTKSLGEVVIRICQDLGLSPDWSAWALEAATPQTTSDEPAADDEALPAAPWRGVTRRRRTHPAASARAGPWPRKSDRQPRAGPETDEKT